VRPHSGTPCARRPFVAMRCSRDTSTSDIRRGSSGMGFTVCSGIDRLVHSLDLPDVTALRPRTAGQQQRPALGSTKSQGAAEQSAAVTCPVQLARPRPRRGRSNAHHDQRSVDQYRAESSCHRSTARPDSSTPPQDSMIRREPTLESLHVMRIRQSERAGDRDAVREGSVTTSSILR